MSVNQPKFSIIVPVYNVDRYLTDCLDSICQQDYSNFELIVVNDGSTDNSRAILESYANKDKRIRIYNTENNGVSAARNLALSVSSGDYVWMVDSDDLLACNALTMLTEVIRQYAPDIITFKYNKLYKNKKDIVIDGSKLINPQKIKKLDFFRSVFNTYQSNIQYMGGYVWLRVFKKDCIGACRFNEQMKYYEDEDFFMRLYKSMPDATTQIFSIENELYYYRKRLSGLINSNRHNRLFSLYRFQRRSIHYFSSTSTEFSLINQNRLMTLTKLQQLALSTNHTSTYKKFREILLKHRKELPLKLILPYLCGKSLAVKYSVQRISKNKVAQKSDSFWD